LQREDRRAIETAVAKLCVHGPCLGYPHSSQVKGERRISLRELRPTGGRKPWRCIYARIGDAFVIAALAPEAKKHKTGFQRALTRAVQRLAEVDS